MPPQYEAPPHRRGRHGLCHSRTATVPCQTVAAGGLTAAMNLDPIASRLADTGVAYAAEIARAARQYRLDPELLAAVAAQETGGPDSNSGRNVVGDGGHGRGLFQIDDRWHAFASSPAAMDPAENADYAAGMISGLLKRYGGNVRAALSAYNAGSPTATGTKTRWSDGSDLSYADSVLRHYARLDGHSISAGAHSSAIAESNEAIASIGPLHARAQQFRCRPSRCTGPHAQPYQRQATDYLQFFNDDSDEKNS